MLLLLFFETGLMCSWNHVCPDCWSVDKNVWQLANQINRWVPLIFRMLKRYLRYIWFMNTGNVLNHVQIAVLCI
jgi:hypothetical protein